MFPGERVGSRQRVADQVVQGHPGGGQGEGAGVDAGEFEKVADHVVEAFDLGADLLQIAVGVGGDAVLQGLRHGAQTGQRGAQVVRDPGDEFAPGGLQRAFPLPGFGESGAGGGQLTAQVLQFGGRRAVGGGEHSAVAEGACGHGEFAAAGHHPAAQQQRGGERDDGRHGDDGRDDAQVVRRQEHRPGDGEGAREHRDDADRRDHGERGGERAAPDQAQGARSGQAGGRGTGEGVQGDEKGVVHDPASSPAGSKR